MYEVRMNFMLIESVRSNYGNHPIIANREKRFFK